MPASTFMPDVTVEVAFATGPDDPSPSWTDISTYVEARDTIGITSGRADELSDIQPGQVTLYLDNKDGRFTPGNVSSPYYPNVRKNRKIRVSAVWPLGGGGSTYRRFTGYVNEWPVEWPDGTSEYAKAQITASSRRARLAGRTELLSIIETEVLADSPQAYYPMGEEQPGDGSGGKAGDVSGNQQPSLVSTGAGFITWQGATGPGTDSLSAPLFNGNGRYLTMTANEPLVMAADTSWTIEAFFNCASSTTNMNIVTLTYDSGPFAAVSFDSSGHLAANLLGPGAGYALTGTTVVDDDRTHHAALRHTYSGGNLTAELFVDGVLEDTDTIASTNADASTFIVASGGAYIGSISHAAVFAGSLTNARILAHATSGLTGFYGESSDARIDRLAGYAGIPVGEVNTEAGLTTSVANQDTTGRTPIDLMEEVTATEGGVLFDAGDGTLTFQSRSHRYNTTSTFTLNAAQDQVEATVTAKMDGAQLVNDFTATGGSGVVVRVVNQASIDEHGVARDSADLITTSDNEVYDAANWRVGQYGEPDVRLTAVTVDLLNQDSSTITSLLAAKIGDRMTITNLPAQAPSATYGGFIEGISEVLGGELYTITFEISPVGLSDVWVLDSSTYSVLDTTTVLAY